MPHPALGRWLRLRLATELGVAANLRIHLPAEFAWQAMREHAPLPVRQTFAPANLRWRIFELLGADVEDDELRRYLADAEPRKRFDLADRLAHVYDRCLLYRPDWIRAWERGDAPHWQARLWRRLREAAPEAKHWVDAIDAYGRAARAAGRGPEQLALDFTGDAPAAAPRQMRLPLDAVAPLGVAGVFFFGMVGLSPSYLEMLRAAALVMDVRLYLLSPCRAYWADIRSPRERPLNTTEDDHFETGNELLAAWGRLARDMQDLLAPEIGLGTLEEAYLEPRQATRLAAVQQDILDLRSAAELAREAAPPPDDSLQVHMCHSAMREAEALHDRLLGLFDAHPDIEPADVLVLAPSLTDYAPAIEAVFSAAGEIPFNIGRLLRRDNAAVQAFLDILALPGSRYGSREVLAPLRAASVQARFGIGDGELAAIAGWLGAAGIRWGIDGDHLRAFGVPAVNGHTWRAGLQRLVLGYAMNDAVVYNDVVPCALDRGAVEGGSADYECLGRLHRYCDELFALAGWMEKAQTPSQWVDDLRGQIWSRFFAHETHREADAVARLLDDFAAECQEAGCVAPIPFAVVRHVLTAAAGEATRAVARLAEGVTVGQLAAGRVHPAQVVCVIGMNDRAFPRHVAEATFDLVGNDERQRGDRDQRQEDRFAFLEALLAARRCFLVTYTGRDQRDDAELPPSVLVSELEDYLAARFEATTIRHPLQPFSRRYFEAPGGRLFSYSQAMAAAANALGAKVAEEAAERFAGELAAAPGERADQLDIADLARFGAGPTRHFVERRLGMDLRIPDDELEDEEVLEVAPLGAWQLRRDLLTLQEDDAPAATAQAVLSARGLLPPNQLGAVTYGKYTSEVKEMIAALAPYEAHRNAAPVELSVPIADLELVGSVEGYCAPARQLLWWRIGHIRERDRIEAWLKLLAVTCAQGDTSRAILIGAADGVRRQLLRGPPPEVAAAWLAEWVAAWRAGDRAALPLFPKTSWAWVSAESADRHQRRRKSLAEWRGNEWGEREDPYNALAFPEEPFVPGFERWAEHLLRPIAEAAETLE